MRKFYPYYLSGFENAKTLRSKLVLTEDYNEIFRRVKDASRTIPSLTDRERSEILCKIAGEIEECQELLLAANQKDLDRMD